MKAFVLITLAAVLALAMPLWAQGPEELYEVKVADITIDGYLEDWAGTVILSTMDNPDNSSPSEDITGDFAITWNGTDKMYMMAQVFDDEVGMSTPQSSFGYDPDHSMEIASYWLNDCVEIYFQDVPDKDLALKLALAPDENRILYQTAAVSHYDMWLEFGEVNPLGTSEDERSPKEPPIAETVVIRDGADWVAETAITLLGHPAQDEMRVNFVINDLDGTDLWDFDAGAWAAGIEPKKYACVTSSGSWSSMQSYWDGNNTSPMYVLHFSEEATGVEASSWGQIKAAF